MSNDIEEYRKKTSLEIFLKEEIKSKVQNLLLYHFS